MAQNGRSNRTRLMESPLVVAIVVALIGAVVPALLSWALAKERYQESRLPITANKSLEIDGAWEVEYSDNTAYRRSGGAVPIEVQGTADPTQAVAATIEVALDG